MIIKENRKQPDPPPVESYTLEVSPEELRMIKLFTEHYAADTAVALIAAPTAAKRLLTKLPLNDTLPWNPDACFKDNK